MAVTKGAKVLVADMTPQETSEEAEEINATVERSSRRSSWGDGLRPDQGLELEVEHSVQREPVFFFVLRNGLDATTRNSDGAQEDTG